MNYNYTILRHDLTFTDIYTSGIIPKLGVLHDELSDTFGKGRYNLTWEQYGNKDIVCIAVYTEEDYTILKLKFSAYGAAEL